MAELDDPRVLHHNLGVHNEYVGQFVERGVLGLLVYLWMMGMLVLHIRKRVRTRKRKKEPLDTPLGAALPLIFLIILIGVGGNLMQSPVFFLHFAVITSLTRIPELRTNDDRSRLLLSDARATAA